MKNTIKKLSLLLIICALITPGFNVWATGEENTETTGGNNTETVTPSPSPSASPSPSPSASPEVEVEKTKNDDATLSKLEIDGVEFTETFNPEKLEYKAIVKGDVSSVKISATPSNVLSKIDSSSKAGLQELVIGDNNFNVKVVAESGKELTYKITVVRAQSDLNLTKLNIQGQKLNEVFDPENYEYTADVTYNVTSITVQHGRPKGTSVSVSGNSNLKVGKNTVTITVKNELNETKEYKIIVTRSDEEKIDEENDEDETTTEEITTSDVTSDVTPVVSDDSDDVDLDTENDNTLRSVIIITSTVLLLLIAGLGIYFYVRTGNSEKKRQKKIDKLKRKQAKIEEQLTGLMPVITEEQEKEYLTTKEEKVSKAPKKTIEEELESTIEIDLSKELAEPRKRRVEKHVLEDDFDDFDDLFDDRDE